MPTLRFKIGDAFPADDPVARFVTVLSMMSNDWLRLMDDMLVLDDHVDRDAGAQRVWSFRQQAALHHEAAGFIQDVRRRFSEINSFVEGLDGDAQTECDQIVGAIDSESDHYLGDWLEAHRNVTFHYPEMHPEKAAHGQEEIHQALTKAAELESTITAGGHFGSVRFNFADDVGAQWLPDVETQLHLIEQLRESVAALARFVQRAAGEYLRSRPAGTVVLEEG